jgi:D-alanyl-D-alanine carboxypeptidase
VSSLSDRVPIPPKESMNTGLSSATEQIMLRKFGKPGALTKDCSAATGTIRRRIKSGVDVGPFKVSGLDFAVESLRQIFDEVEVKHPLAFKQVKTAGMLCVRHRRSNPSRYSNHSWGAAIDLYFGTRVVPQGTHLTHRGLVLLAPFFNRHGWYWGAEFSGDSVDSMHFELAAETILKLPSGAL